MQKKRTHNHKPNEFDQKIKREPSKEFEIFTFDEVQLLIDVARPKWLGNMILLAYNTGMRKCECYGLQWEDIDFKQKNLFCEKECNGCETP